MVEKGIIHWLDEILSGSSVTQTDEPPIACPSYFNLDSNCAIENSQQRLSGKVFLRTLHPAVKLPFANGRLSPNFQQVFNCLREFWDQEINSVRLVVSQTEQKMASVADHLMNLSTHLIESLNTRTFGIVAPMYMVPTFSGSHLMDQTDWALASRDEVVAQIEEWLEKNPNFHTEIVDISVNTIAETNTAYVWIRRTDTGLAQGPNRETLMQLTWALRDGEWVCEGYQVCIVAFHRRLLTIPTTFKGVRSFPFYGGIDEPDSPGTMRMEER